MTENDNKFSSGQATLLQKFTRGCLWTCCSVCLTNVLIRRVKMTLDHCSFHTLLDLQGSRWCGVLAFVSNGSFSSSSAFQIFRDLGHLWWLIFAVQFACLAISFDCNMSWTEDRRVSLEIEIR